MTDHTALKSLIEAAFEQRAEITPKSISRELRVALDEVLDLLDQGKQLSSCLRSGNCHDGYLS